MSSVNRLLLVVLSVFSFASVAKADLESVMRQMGSALRAMNTDAASPSPSGQTAAQSLKLLSIDASKLSPVSDPAKSLEFEGLLLQVSVKANAYQQANLRSNVAVLQATVGEIRNLMAQGHAIFNP